MGNEIIMLFMSFCGLDYSNFDHIVVYDHIANKLYAISYNNYKQKNFDNYITINKSSDFMFLGNIVLVNLEKFVTMFPESKIEDYKNSQHTKKASSNIDLYLASYINLYRIYKSLPVLVENNYSKTIDTFIDCCINENTDHPATLAYNPGKIHSVFRLKKVNYQIFKRYLTDHEIYRKVLGLQNEFKQTESQMRQICRKYKMLLKKEEEAAKKKAAAAGKKHETDNGVEGDAA